MEQIIHRITVFNPTASNDGTLQHVNSTNLVINPTTDDFTVEHKLVIPTSWADLSRTFPLIDKLRIQSKLPEAESHPVFNYEFTRGVNIYVAPKPMGEEAIPEFYQQAQEMIRYLLNIEVEQGNWTISRNSLYYYSSKPGILNESLLGFLDYEIPDAPKAWDLGFEWQTGLVLKQLDTIPQAPLSISLNAKVKKEIGLFMSDKISSPDDIVLSGIRVVLEDDQEPENVFKTMFHIKPRHRYLKELIASSNVEANGLHPIISTSISPQLSTFPLDEDVEDCKLYYYIGLDKSLIFDRYQSTPINATVAAAYGNFDLELPEYKVDQWGSEVLFEYSSEHLPLDKIDFTLHSRYQSPDNTTISSVVKNPLPQLFLGCNVKESNLLETSPFDNKMEFGGNYESLFTNNTVFYHIEHDSASNVELEIPHGSADAEQVISMTAIGIAIGILLILVQFLRVVLKRFPVDYSDVQADETKKNE